MRIIRRSVLPALVVAGLLTVGANAASASVLQDSSGNPVTVGSSTTATGLVELSAGITNTCTASLTAQVTDNGSVSGTPSLDVTSASFTSCSFAPVTVNALPWTLTPAPSAGAPYLELSGVNVSIAGLFYFTGTLSQDDPGTTEFSLGNACSGGDTSLLLDNVGHLTNGTFGSGQITSVDSSGATTPLCADQAWSLV
jgi:hypothetical protein